MVKNHFQATPDVGVHGFKGSGVQGSILVWTALGMRI
jgi:hypothetical protein